MEFFNEFWANVVQHISVFLEGVGLFLTFVEVKRPDIADQIEKWIDVTSIRCKEQTRIKLLMFENKPESLNFLNKNLRFSDSVFRLMRKCFRIESNVPWPQIFLIVSIMLMLLFIHEYMSLQFLASIYTLILALFFFVVSEFFVIIDIFFNTILIISGGIIPAALLMSLKSIIDVLNKYSGGRAIGTIGVILAFGGLGCEIYQVLTIYLKN